MTLPIAYYIRMKMTRFGDFELDTAARQLLLNGEEISMQPKVFDLLCYLVDHQDRVVDKEELLEQFWPGVIVTDASLQRAISFARNALRSGGMENVIRTYSRRGYRFVLPEQADGPQTVLTGNDRILTQAYAYIDQHKWSEAAETFELADSQQALSVEDLEQWALAAQCAGRLMDAIDPLERAAAAYSTSADRESTARLNLLLARIQLEAQECAIAQGCIARAEKLLKELPTSEQHGHLEWVTARYHCYTGDMALAKQHAMSAIDIGEQLNNVDIYTIATLYYGIAVQALGETRQGLQKQDEAAATVLAGNVSPLIGGIVYCGIIAGCCNTGDWPRAGQWTHSFSRWCDRTKLKTFAGSCILHRAEVYVAHGDMSTARQVLDDGALSLKRSAPWAVGDAYRVMGDIHLARGEFSESEEAYHCAYENGWDPYPGYALLQFYRGQAQAGLRGLQRACDKTHWVAGERRGQNLAFIVIIAAQSGDTDLAEETLAKLEKNPGLWETGSVSAFVSRARGELAIAKNEPDSACQLLQSAMNQLISVELPVEAAMTRLRFAHALLMNNDIEGARMEAGTARRVFLDAHATHYVKLCDEFSLNLGIDS
ncbi:MAG: winged helix-turn-helix domain-containing protein [Gammaproteobacteria bacterium]